MRKDEGQGGQGENNAQPRVVTTDDVNINGGGEQGR